LGTGQNDGGRDKGGAFLRSEDTKSIRALYQLFRKGRRKQGEVALRGKRAAGMYLEALTFVEVSDIADVASKPPNDVLL
jgi:hypothetical protein